MCEVTYVAVLILAFNFFRDSTDNLGLQVKMPTKNRNVYHANRKGRRKTENKSALQRSLDLLNYKSRSSAELKKRLLEEEFDAEEIDSAIRRLQELHLISDEAISAMLARKYAHKGNRFIEQKMKLRGIELPHRESVLETMADEFSRAIYAAQKKIGSLKGKDDNHIRQKMYRFLASSGFGSEVIGKVMRHYPAFEIPEE